MTPRAAVAAHRQALEEAIARVLDSGRYVLGPEVEAFERRFAAWLGVERAVGVGNATDAIALALRALGIGAGDVVATVSHTATATVAAVEMAGARPLLVDIEPRGYGMDPGALEAALSETAAHGEPARAVLVVHLYGQAADLDSLLPVCRRHGAVLIEDCSQAHGATLHGRKLGGFGAAAAFSFYPTKVLAALGDGGAVATSDVAVAERVARLRQYGWDADRRSQEPGVNSRLDELQAAVLNVRLPLLAEEAAQRRRLAARYDAALPQLGVQPPWRRPHAEHAWHQYVVRTPRRGRVLAQLQAAGVPAAVHYATPVHKNPAYAERAMSKAWSLVETEKAADEVLSLPIHPQMTEDDVDRVIDHLKIALSGGAA